MRFAVAIEIAHTNDRGALDLLPLQLWSATPDKVTQLELERGAA